MIRLAVKILLALILVGLMFAYAMFQGGFVSWFLFYSVMPLILYAFAIAVYPLKAIEVERKLITQSYIADHPLQVVIHIKKSFFPLFYLVVEENLPPKLNKSMQAKNEAKAIFFPFFKRKMSYTYEIPCLPRGEHRFTRVILKSGDPFGFVRKQATLDLEEQRIFVYPKVERVDWNPFQHDVEGDGTFSRRSNMNGTTVVSVRNYVSGDRLSWLDWKATAKRNKLLTKQFEQQKNEDVVLFLDCSKESNVKNADHLFEEMVSLSASLVAAARKSGGNITMPMLANRSMQKTSARHEREQFMYYLLAKVERDSPLPFADHVQECLRQISEVSYFVFVTAMLSDALYAQIEQLAFQREHVECFYMTEQGQNGENTVHQLRKHGVTVHIIEVSSPVTDKKAGISRAENNEQ